jgi:hypothetical protein
MSLIVEVNEDGALTLPPEAIGNAKPRARFIVESLGEALTLRPEKETQFSTDDASIQKWIEDFNCWVESHKDGPNLPLEALSRESIYE